MGAIPASYIADVDAVEDVKVVDVATDAEVKEEE